MNIEGKEIRLAVLGNCATQFLSEAVEGYGKIEGLNMCVYDADYNQIDAQLLDASSEVYSFHPTQILIWLATEKLYEEFLDLDISARGTFAGSGDDKEMLSSVSVIHFNPEPEDMQAGAVPCRVPPCTLTMERNTASRHSPA